MCQGPGVGVWTRRVCLGHCEPGRERRERRQGDLRGSLDRLYGAGHRALVPAPEPTWETHVKSRHDPTGKPGADTRPLTPSWTTGQRQHEA